MTPNYLVIGAQKCATSSLCELLGRHPDVFMTEPKEPYFFSHEDRWQRGWSWYESLFEGAAGCTAVGEGSTTYTMRWLYPRAAERIAEHLPHTKLIYIVRDPLDRIRSHWIHLASRGGREDRPLNEAVAERPEYIDTSLYARQIDVYRQTWPDERILVLFFEDFVADQIGVAKRCFEFLGVDPEAPLPDAGVARNVSVGSRRDRRFLKALRRLPLFESIRSAVPESVRHPLRLLAKAPTPTPQWDEPTRLWVMDQIREDSHAFLERYGKPKDFWGF